jgi:hypothetical protein
LPNSHDLRFRFYDGLIAAAAPKQRETARFALVAEDSLMFFRPYWLAALVALLSLAVCNRSQAQVRFSIGGSGWSVGNAPSWYDSGYGYGYGSGYGYGPRYYSPPVVIERQVVQPQVRYVPVQAQPAAYQGQGIAIRNPAKTETTLSYTIDSQDEHAIAAGETQRLKSKRICTIDFDRGGDFGHARYSIYEGWYQFTPTDRGWELFRQLGPMPADETTASEKTKVKANPLPGDKAESAEEPEDKQPPPPVPPEES